MNEADQLRERWKLLQERGVLDVKISFGPLSEETTESVCRSLNEAFDAIERGDYDEAPWLNDSRRRPPLQAAERKRG